MTAIIPLFTQLEYLVPARTVIGPYSHLWRNGHKRVEWQHRDNQQLQRYEGEYLMIHTHDDRKLPDKSNTSTQMTVSDFDSMMEGVMEICHRNNVPWDHLDMPHLFSGTTLNIVCILRVGKTRPGPSAGCV